MLLPEQELIVVELYKTLLLPTDDLLAIIRKFNNPTVSRRAGGGAPSCATWSGRKVPHRLRKTLSRITSRDQADSSSVDFLAGELSSGE